MEQRLKDKQVILIIQPAAARDIIFTPCIKEFNNLIFLWQLSSG